MRDSLILFFQREHLSGIVSQKKIDQLMVQKILIITNHYPDRSPGQRFRFEQYLSYLRSQGIQIDVSFLLNEKDDKIFYSKGNYFGKVGIAIKSILKRMKDLRHASKYDIVFIFREAIFFGTSFFEKRFAKKTKIVFD